MNEKWTSSAREEAIEAIREASRAIERQDREALMRLVAERWHEDCEWTPLIAEVEGERTYRGRDGLVTFYEDLWKAFEVRYGEPELRQIGSAVVYLTTMELHGRQSGIEVNSELGVVWEFDGDLIRRGTAFDSHAAALAAAEEIHAQA